MYCYKPVSTGFTLTEKCELCADVNTAFPGKLSCGHTGCITPECQIRIKPMHEKFVMPFRATPESVGYDLTATRKEFSTSYVRYWLGFAMELPKGWHAEIFPRSSISKTNLIQANSIGIIDTDYRNELFVDFRKTEDFAWPTIISYKVGERVAQMIIRKTHSAEFILAQSLTTTERTGGHGSTGN